MITIKRVDFQGTSEGRGFEQPDLTRAIMTEPNWLAVDQRSRHSPQEYVRVSFGNGAMTVDGLGRYGEVSLRYNKLLDGELYATAKVSVSTTAPGLPGLPGLPPSALRKAVTPVKWQLLDDSMKRPSSCTVAIPMGANYARVTIARVGGEVWMTCDGMRQGCLKSEGPVFAGVQTRTPGPQLVLEDVQIFAEQVTDPPRPEPPALAAGGWQVDQSQSRWRDTAAKQVKVLEDDGKVRLETTELGSPVPVTRVINEAGDFEATVTVTQPPLEFFGGSRPASSRLNVELKAESGSSSMISVGVPPPVAGEPTDHVVLIRRKGDLVTITSGSETKWGSITGNVQLNLRLHGRNHFWLSPLAVGPLKAPAGIAVPESVQLPAAAEDVAMAGCGRYLLLHLKSLKKLALFNVQKAEISRFLPAEDSVLFAGGLEHFVVLDTASRELHRYRIEPFKLEQTVSLPDGGTPVDVATSAATAGAIVIVATDESARVTLHGYDLQTLEPIDLEFPRRQTLTWRRDAFLYAGGDGRSFSLSSGCAHFTLSGRQVDVQGMSGASWLVPGPLGKYLYTERSVYNSQRKLVESGTPSRWANIPAVEGPLYLSLEPDQYKTSRSPTTGAFKLRLPERPEPLVSFDDLRLGQELARLAEGRLSIERRLFLIPGDGLIVMLDESNAKVWIQKFDLKEILADLDGEYFFVNSQPPAAIDAGEEYSYAMDVLTSGGKVNYELVSGPDGMEVSEEGVVTWDVPQDAPALEDHVIVTLRNAANESLFHTFPVRVNGKDDPASAKPERVAARPQTPELPKERPEPKSQPTERVTDAPSVDEPAGLPANNVETVELKLPAAISGTALGGSGDLLLLHFAELRKIACFDFRSRKIVKFIPVPDNDAKFAAGANKLVLYLPETQVLSRYDLATFGRELTVSVTDSISALGMGYASNGPLWVVRLSHHDGRGQVFDVQKLKVKDVRYRKTYNGRTFPSKESFETGPRIRVSANGRVLCGTRTGGSPTGVFVATLTGDTVDSRYDHESWGLLRPGPHGDVIYTARGPITKELKPLREAFEQYTFRVHAIGGHYHLQLRKPKNSRNGSPTLTLHFGDDDHVLKSFDADRMGLTNLPLHPVSFSQTEFDKRIFFHPQEKLLVTVDASRSKLLLTAIDIDRVLDESGIDYLFVKSRPPEAVRPGAVFQYELDVCSKHGGVQIKLESGPDGMQLNGNQLRWTASESEESNVVLLSIRDAGGQEIFHKFQLAVSPHAEEIAANVRPVPLEVTPAKPTPPSGPALPAPAAASLAESKTVKLPDTVGDICAAANGRLLLAHLPTLRQLAVFDLRQHKVAKYLSLSGADIKFAAGREKLFVYAGESHTLSRYDLTSFQRELTKPVDKPIDAMAMGHAADGPLWTVTKDRYSGACRLYDPESLAPVKLQVTGRRPGNGNVGFETGTLLDVSADGRTLGSTRERLSPSGFYLATLEGKTITAFYGHESMGRIRPGPRGEVIFTNRGAVGRNMQPVNTLTGLPIHAIAGDYYLNVKRPNTYGREATGATVSFHHVNSTSPLATMRADKLGVAGNASSVHHNYQYEGSIFFNADENVLVTVKADKTTLQVTPLDVNKLLDESGIDYLFVSSRPPRVVRPGSKLKYKMAVRSKRGGTRFQLESGPDGMELAGDELIWLVPSDFSEKTVTVLVAVSDDSGQEVFHKFSLAINADSAHRPFSPESPASPTPAPPSPKLAKRTVPLKDFDALQGGPGQDMDAKGIAKRYTSSVAIVADRRSTGSGFVVGKDGLVLTCAHCVRSSPVKIVLRVNEGSEPDIKPAKVVCRDDKRDIALLRFSPDGPLQPVRLAPAIPVELGERVTVIANPGLGEGILAHTLTQGVVSNAGRDTGDQKLIQTSAAINPGSSGGPMFNERGLVIGMVTAKAGIEATGFAISASDLTQFLLLSANTTDDNAALKRTWVDSNARSVEATYVTSDGKTVRLSRSG